MNTPRIDTGGNVRNYLDMPDHHSYPEFVHRFANACPQLLVHRVTASMLTIPMFSTP